jgi:hypothetical protein
MTIRDTIQAIRTLAADVPHDAAGEADDLHEAEFLLASCDPPLSAAAYQHTMSMFLRLREQAVQSQEV